MQESGTCHPSWRLSRGTHAPARSSTTPGDENRPAARQRVRSRLRRLRVGGVPRRPRTPGDRRRRQPGQDRFPPPGQGARGRGAHRRAHRRGGRRRARSPSATTSPPPWRTPTSRSCASARRRPRAAGCPPSTSSGPATEIGAALPTRTTGTSSCSAARWCPAPARASSMPMLEQASGKRAGVDFGVCVNPEFLREGTSVRDFDDPPKTVVGAERRAQRRRGDEPLRRARRARASGSRSRSPR